jgi:hypothetical protein
MKEIGKKYKDRIYTKQGEVNMNTLRAIAKEAGLFNAWIYKDHYGFLYINDNPIDVGDINEEQEVISAYNFCSHLVKRDKRLNRNKKLKELLGE